MSVLWVLASRWRCSQIEMHSLKLRLAKIRHFPLCIKEDVVRIQNNPRERMVSIITHWSPLTFRWIYDVVHIHIKNNLVRADVFVLSKADWKQLTPNCKLAYVCVLIFKHLSFCYVLTGRSSFDNKRLIFRRTETVKLLSTVSLLSMQVCGLAVSCRWCPPVRDGQVGLAKAPEGCHPCAYHVLRWSGREEVVPACVSVSFNIQSSPPCLLQPH